MILLLYLVRATIIIVAAAAVLAVSGQRSSAAFRHFICTVAVGGLLALPILSAVLPAWELSRPAVTEKSGRVEWSGPAEDDDVSSPANGKGYDVPGRGDGGHDRLSDLGKAGPYVLAFYLAGVLLLIARLGVDRFNVRRLARRAVPLTDPRWQTLFREYAEAFGVRGRVQLLRAMERTTPMAIGIRHPAIVVPMVADAWSDEMRRAVLLHELAHVARRDCLTQTAASLACALCWIHPGAWWVARRLRTERELACDDLVLLAGTDAHDYASHLLEVAYTFRSHMTPVLTVGMAAPGQIEARLHALLDAARNRTAPSRFAKRMVLAVAALLLVPIAAATAAQTQTADDPAPAVQEQSASALKSEWVSRFLSLDYWRNAASEGLSRLADQANYLIEMRQLGYSATDADVLFKLRQHGVTPDLVRQLNAEGLSDLSSDDLLKAVSHGISPEYIHDLKSLGYSGLDLESLVRMRSHGIDGEFIRDMRTFGYRWSLDELVQARSHGIDGDFVLMLSSIGYEHLTLEELTVLRSHGVTLMRIRSANQAAGTRLSVSELRNLASHGWKP